MRDAIHYRQEAARARRLARSVTNGGVEAILLQIAHQYEDIAVDMETGAIEVRHPELTQTRR